MISADSPAAGRSLHLAAGRAGSVRSPVSAVHVHYFLQPYQTPVPLAGQTRNTLTQQESSSFYLRSYSSSRFLIDIFFHSRPSLPRLRTSKRESQIVEIVKIISQYQQQEQAQPIQQLASLHFGRQILEDYLPWLSIRLHEGQGEVCYLLADGHFSCLSSFV